MPRSAVSADAYDDSAREPGAADFADTSDDVIIASDNISDSQKSDRRLPIFAPKSDGRDKPSMSADALPLDITRAVTCFNKPPNDFMHILNLQTRYDVI